VSLFIRAPDSGFLKPLRRASQFLGFGRAQIIYDTNIYSSQYTYLALAPPTSLNLKSKNSPTTQSRNAPAYPQAAEPNS